MVPARSHPLTLHPLHAVLLASTLPLYVGAMLSDITYAYSYQIQWTNFASWLITGGLLLGAVVLLWTLVDLVRGVRTRRFLAYLALLLATWVVAFANALVHARDGWASMPAGLVLSVLAVLLACAATWLGFARTRAGERT